MVNTDDFDQEEVQQQLDDIAAESAEKLQTVADDLPEDFSTGDVVVYFTRAVMKESLNFYEAVGTADQVKDQLTGGLM